MAVTLVQITAYDPVAAAAVTVRACNADDPRVTSLNGVRWWPVLARAPQRRLDLFDGDFSGQIGVGIGDLEISTKAHPDAPRYSWGERAVTIWRGPLGGAWGDYVQVFQGLTRPARGGNGRLIIGLRPDDRWLDKPLLPTYAGTGLAEGPAELKGVAKPLALGAPQFAPGILINRTLNIWQLSAFAIQAVPVALDRLARFSGGAYTGNDATYAALAAASIPAGSWRSCLALGLVRFGAPPAVPSFLIEGDNGGGAGWVRRPGAIIKRIAEIAGATAGQINSASMAALDGWAATLPGGGNISLWLGQQATARDVIQQIAASCNAAAGIGWDGRLFVARAGIGTPTITLAADGSRTPAVADVQLQETSAPFHRLAMAAEPTWRVHSEGEYGQIGVADQITYPDGTLVSGLQPGDANATRNVARGTYDAGTGYTRGDEVIFSGSSYRLIVASSTGNAPPDVSRWALIAAAGSGPPGDDGLEGITVIVSNEAHTVPTNADGSGGSYASAGGTMIVRRGATLLTPTFSIAAQSPATGWASIDSGTGVYTVTDPGVTLATATLRATVGGVNYDRTYTLAKSLQGVAGPNLTLVSDGQAFTFTDGTASPGSQTITLNALLTNLSGTATWTATPSVTLGGSGNTRTLAVADFGTNRQVVIEATLAGITDRITLLRQERDIAAANAVVNSEFARGTYGFRFVANTLAGPLLPVVGGVNLSSSWSGIKNVMWATVNTSGAAWDAAGLTDPFTTRGIWIDGNMPDQRAFGLPVKQGDNVFARCLLARHRCTTQLYLLVFDKDGTLLEAPNWTGGRVDGAGGGNPANFDVVGGTHVVSNANAATAQLMWRMLSTSQADPYIFMTEPAIGLLPKGQTELPPYQPGNSDPLADATRDTLPALNRGAWSASSIAYALGDIVTRSGSSYTCIIAHTSTGGNGPPGSNWALLADAGAQGPTGVSAPPIKSLATGAAQLDPVRLTSGQTVTVAAELYLNTGGVAGVCSLELQISEAGAGSWATMTGGTVTDSQPTSEAVELVIAGATFTNGGADRLFDIRAVSVRQSRGVNVPPSFVRVL